MLVVVPFAAATLLDQLIATFGATEWVKSDQAARMVFTRWFVELGVAVVELEAQLMLKSEVLQVVALEVGGQTEFRSSLSSTRRSV